MAGKWAKPHGHWEWSDDGADVDIASMSADEMFHPPADDGDRWGDWVYSKANQTLTYEPANYEIRLDEVTDTASFVDWLAHLLETKPFMSTTALGDFTQAVDDIVGLRSLMDE